ncbi:ribonuclease H [Gemmatimonadota bacterium]
MSEAETPRVFIHADESCLGNQFQARKNPGGAAGLVEHWREDACERRDYWISEADTTNNRMALRSGIEALRLLRLPCRVHFVSDSQYLVRGMEEWVKGWKGRGWKRKAGPIENLDLWKELDRQSLRHRVGWHWVQGHSGHARNEYANHLATRAAREQDASGGLIESGFTEWLEKRRDTRGDYLDFFEHLPPDLEE